MMKRGNGFNVFKNEFLEEFVGKTTELSTVILIESKNEQN